MSSRCVLTAQSPLSCARRPATLCLCLPRNLVTSSSTVDGRTSTEVDSGSSRCVHWGPDSAGHFSKALTRVRDFAERWVSSPRDLRGAGVS